MQHIGGRTAETAERILAARQRFDRACVALTQGQHLDLGFESRSSVTEADYLHMVYGKTAALIEAGVPIRHIEQGKKDGRLLTGGERVGGEGYFLQPTVFADIPPKSKLEQEEIFGPVLCVIKSRNYDHALEIANDTEFGLTGAVYSSSREKLDRAVREFHVGNLYLNRKCTGAIVGAHPFGGFNMSGTDSKAGGRDYLLLFMQAKVSSEKVGATRKRAEASTGI